VFPTLGLVSGKLLKDHCRHVSSIKSFCRHKEPNERR
jgi:hypothetical protein